LHDDHAERAALAALLEEHPAHLSEHELALALEGGPAAALAHVRAPLTWALTRRAPRQATSDHVDDKNTRIAGPFSRFADGPCRNRTYTLSCARRLRSSRLAGVFLLIEESAGIVGSAFAAVCGCSVAQELPPPRPHTAR
jgi:hypothetical protein